MMMTVLMRLASADPRTIRYELARCGGGEPPRDRLRSEPTTVRTLHELAARVACVARVPGRFGPSQLDAPSSITKYRNGRDCWYATVQRCSTSCPAADTVRESRSGSQRRGEENAAEESGPRQPTESRSETIRTGRGWPPAVGLVRWSIHRFSPPVCVSGASLSSKRARRRSMARVVRRCGCSASSAANAAV